MVRAILGGNKTQTRRVLKPQPKPFEGGISFCCHGDKTWSALSLDGDRQKFKCPYGKAGDRLWVKETFFKPDKSDPHFAGLVGDYIYRAQYDYREDRSVIGDNHWKPSIFMPRWASRITLEIIAVRVERLADITFADCMAEGIQPAGRDAEEVRHAYHLLWDSLNEKRGFGWMKNPCVWVVVFKRIDAAKV